MLLLILLLAPFAAGATPIKSNLAFTKVNQNPWTSGDAFKQSWTYTPSASFDVSLPTTGLTPWGVLSNFLHLPQIGFARASAHVAGSFGLNLGYAVDGGRMNIVYPGNATVDMHGPTALGNFVSPGVMVHTDTSFTPGLTHTYTPPSTFTAFTGITTSIPGFNFDSIEDPTFKTYFPTASAWAGFDYDLRAGFKVDAGVADTPLGCVLCFSRSADFERKGTVEIANVNPAGVQLIGQGRQDLFGQDFALGGGTLRVDYPDLSVGGALQADGSTLAGSGIASIITFNADIEKLIPFIGPFLHEAIGPFDLKLLGIAGGPGLGLYQDFEIDVDPQVELRFNQPVMSYAGGIPTLTTTIRTTLGSSVDWMPMANTGVPLSVQAVFIPDATIHNRTGFAVGYDLDVSALKLRTPFADIGPVATAHLEDPGALKLPAFYDATFDLDLADIAVAPVTLDMLTSFERVGSSHADFRVAGLEPSGDGDGLFTLLLVDQVSGAHYSLDVLGHLVTTALSGGPAHDTVFVADSDVIVNYMPPNVDDPHARVPVNLGTHFCIYCAQANDHFMPTSSSFIDSASGDALFVNDLGDIRADDVNYLRNPDINRATFDAVSVDRAVIGPIVPFSDVPEPDALGLFGLGLLSMVMLAAARRQSRKRMCQNKT